jgi:HEAT repeat protein
MTHRSKPVLHLARPAFLVLVLILVAGCGGTPEQRVSDIYHWKEDPTEENLRRIRLALEDDDSNVRVTAMFMLVQLGVPDAGDLVLSHVEDENAFARATAAKLLGDLKDVRGVEPLARLLLEDSEWQVRRRAGEALAVFDAAAAEDALVRGLDDPVKEVRLAVARSVGRRAPPSAWDRAARIALEDTEWEIRVQALQLLGRIPNPEGALVVRRALDDPHEFVRAAAAQAERSLQKTLREAPAAAPPAADAVEGPDPGEGG